MNKIHEADPPLCLQRTDILEGRETQAPMFIEEETSTLRHRVTHSSENTSAEEKLKFIQAKIKEQLSQHQVDTPAAKIWNLLGLFGGAGASGTASGFTIKAMIGSHIATFTPLLSTVVLSGAALYFLQRGVMYAYQQYVAAPQEVAQIQNATKEIFFEFGELLEAFKITIKNTDIELEKTRSLLQEAEEVCHTLKEERQTLKEELEQATKKLDTALNKGLKSNKKVKDNTNKIASENTKLLSLKDEVEKLNVQLTANDHQEKEMEQGVQILLEYYTTTQPLVEGLKKENNDLQKGEISEDYKSLLSQFCKTLEYTQNLEEKNRKLENKIKELKKTKSITNFF